MRLLIAVLVGKLIARILKATGHSATTWPGHIALTFDPGLVRKLENCLPKGSVLITGTNGKTTTANMLAHIFKDQGWQVVHNKTSANLLNGIASSLILSTKNNITYPHFVDNSVGVFEVDEAYLSTALDQFKPEVLVLTNLSRDQLDRYGEIDLLVDKWRTSLKELAVKNALPFIVYDSSNEHLAKVVKGLKKEKLYRVSNLSKLPKLLKSRDYPAYSQTNASLAIEAASQLAVNKEYALNALKTFTPVFGRGETIIYGSTAFYLYLAKNPQSYNLNLQYWLTRKAAKKTGYLLVLNDNIPDGRDISWIYDIDSDLLYKLLKDCKVYTSGIRAYDMALRLKYAGLETKNYVITNNINEAINKAVKECEEVVVFPTYSAMLEVRKVLVGKSFTN